MNKITNILSLIVRTLRRFVSLSFIFIVMLIVVRVFEIVITSNFSGYPVGSSIPLLKGIIFDLIFYLQISALLIVPYLLIGLIKQKLARQFYSVVAIVLILSDILLMKYFSVTLKPLGAELFDYSFQEIWGSIHNSGEVTIAAIVVTLLFLAYMIRRFYKHVYFKLQSWLVLVIVVLMISSLASYHVIKPQPNPIKDQLQLHMAANKLSYFCESVIDQYVYDLKLND